MAPVSSIHHSLGNSQLKENMVLLLSVLIHHSIHYLLHSSKRKRRHSITSLSSVEEGLLVKAENGDSHDSMPPLILPCNVTPLMNRSPGTTCVITPPPPELRKQLLTRTSNEEYCDKTRQEFCDKQRREENCDKKRRREEPPPPVAATSRSSSRVSLTLM